MTTSTSPFVTYKARIACDNGHRYDLPFIRPTVEDDGSISGALSSEADYCRLCDTKAHVEYAFADETCQWFLLCDNPATAIMSHPILGGVPICRRCEVMARYGQIDAP